RFAFPESVVRSLVERRPTGFYGVPTTYSVLLKRTTFLQRDLSFLRYVAQAGGSMRVDTIRRLRGSLARTAIYIMYGQTEATARLTFLPPELLDSKMGSVGKPVPGMEVRVVDGDGLEVPPGRTGEIVARGPAIMAGYYNDPDGTRDALRGGWLHTGHIGWA